MASTPHWALPTQLRPWKKAPEAVFTGGAWAEVRAAPESSLFPRPLLSLLSTQDVTLPTHTLPTQKAHLPEASPLP